MTPHEWVDMEPRTSSSGRPAWRCARCRCWTLCAAGAVPSPARLPECDWELVRRIMQS